jgi:hypothetical protein
MNREINYWLNNSWGVTVGIRVVAFRTLGVDLLGVRSRFIRAFCPAEYRT